MKYLSLLIKPASSTCNLRCRYCFYADIADSRKIKNYGIMSRDCTNELLKEAFETGVEHISFAFQGGEPLTAGIEYFKHFVMQAKLLNTKNIHTY